MKKDYYSSKFLAPDICMKLFEKELENTSGCSWFLPEYTDSEEDYDLGYDDPDYFDTYQLVEEDDSLIPAYDLWSIIGVKENAIKLWGEDLVDNGLRPHKMKRWYVQSIYILDVYYAGEDVEEVLRRLLASA